MRDIKHYMKMLDENPSASVGHLLAAKMIMAARGVPDVPNSDEELHAASRRLVQTYGESLTNDEVRAEIAAYLP